MKSRHLCLLIVALALVILPVATGTGCWEWTDWKSRSIQLQKLPDIVIWAWDHSDNLEFVDPSKVAVAQYVGTIVLGRNTATLVSRRSELHVERNVAHFPVFRIQNAHQEESASPAAWRAARDLISRYMQEHPCGIVQIDCDARFLDRQGYMGFLKRLREVLSRDTAISITALASWCLADKWLQAAPIDETVAMMFSLGTRRAETIATLARDGLCTGNPAIESLGISVSDGKTAQKMKQLGYMRRAPRVYVFSPLGWTKSRYERLMAEVKSKQ